MIELPEAVVLSKQINTTLPGKKISNVIANQSPHKFAWFSGDPANYPNLLIGKTIRAALSYGNHIEIHAGDMLLIISTPIRYHTQGEKPPKKHQLLVDFEDGTAISCVVQMWGALICINENEKSGLSDYIIAKGKPSPLSDQFDKNYFDGLVEQTPSNLSAKAFLATEQRIPGLGNGVLQDILWTAKVHPKRKLADLSQEDIQRMYASAKNVLADMTVQGGRDTEHDLFGQPGGYKTVLSKNTVGTPCLDCGGLITKEAYMGGSIYYCPICQKI